MYATAMMKRPCKELAPLPSALLVLSAVCSAGRVESLVLQGRFIIAESPYTVHICLGVRGPALPASNVQHIVWCRKSCSA